MNIFFLATFYENQSFFPLLRKFKQKAVKAGANFPKPYGIGASMFFQRQDMHIEKIKLGTLELSRDNGVINFGDSKISNTVITN